VRLPCLLSIPVVLESPLRWGTRGYGGQRHRSSGLSQSRRVREPDRECEDDARNHRGVHRAQLGFQPESASLGFRLANAPRVIGARIIAPWITPLRGHGLGISCRAGEAGLQGLFTLLRGA